MSEIYKVGIAPTSEIIKDSFDPKKHKTVTLEKREDAEDLYQSLGQQASGEKKKDSQSAFITIETK
jgi:hypothetical protein